MRWGETAFLLRAFLTNVSDQMQHQEGTLEFSGLFLMNSSTIKMIWAYPSTPCAMGVHSTSTSLFPCCLWQCSHLLNKLNASATLKNNLRNVSLQPAKAVPSAHKLWKWCLSCQRTIAAVSHMGWGCSTHGICAAPTPWLSKSHPRAAVNMSTFKWLHVMPSDTQTSSLCYMRPASKFCPFSTMWLRMWALVGQISYAGHSEN